MKVVDTSEIEFFKNIDHVLKTLKDMDLTYSEKLVYAQGVLYGQSVALFQLQKDEYLKWHDKYWSTKE